VDAEIRNGRKQMEKFGLQIPNIGVALSRIRDYIKNSEGKEREKAEEAAKYLTFILDVKDGWNWGQCYPERPVI
jgi:hypothetical protein